MTGVPSYGLRSPWRMTVDEFRDWLATPPLFRHTPPPGIKWRVRVPVERQTPNEADL